MKIVKVYLGEDEETLLVQFNDGEIAEYSAAEGANNHPGGRVPEFWREMTIRPPIVLREAYPNTGSPRRIFDEKVCAPPQGEELPFTGMGGTQYWWNGKYWCLFDFRFDGSVAVKTWPPDTKDGPWIEGLVALQ